MEILNLKPSTLSIKYLEATENMFFFKGILIYSCWFQPTHLKNMRKSNWIISPGKGKNWKITTLKPPPTSFKVTLLGNPYELLFVTGILRGG